MRLRSLVFCCLCSTASHSWADEFHNNNLLIGGDALGLGGAFVSIADDLSATHYNPAGLAFAKTNTTASINTFAWEQTEFSKVFSNGDHFTRESFSIVPGFFGASQKFGEWTIGGSLAVSDFSNERTSNDVTYMGPAPAGADKQQVTEFINIDLDNSAYKLALSAAYQVSTDFAWGFSLQGEYRDFKTVQGSGVSIATHYGEYISLNGFEGSRRFTDTNLIVQPTLGLIWKQDALSIGMRFSKEFSVSRDYDVTSTIYLASPIPLPPNVQIASRISESSDEKQAYPYQLAFGASYQFAKLLVSVDGVYFSEVHVEPAKIERLYTPITRDLKQVTNFALGIAYNVGNESALKFSVFSDNSNGIIDTEIDFQRIEDIDLIGYSLAFDTKIMSYPLSLGLYYKSGSGKIRTADIRTVESIVGLPLYPPSDSFDIINGKKRALVMYLSLNF